MKDGREWGQLDAVAALVTVLDREGRIVVFNRACETLTGWSAADVQGRFVWDVVIAPEQVGEIRDVFARLRAGAFPNKHENYWVTRGGERRWIAWSNTAQLDTRGEVELVVATGVDISERKHIEEALRRSEEHFRVLDQIGDVIGHALPDYEETLRAVARVAVDSFADVCTIALVEPSSGALRRVAAVCSDPAVRTVVDRLLLLGEKTNAKVFGRVLRARRAELHTVGSTLENGGQLDPDYVEALRGLGDSSHVILAPLLSRGRGLGIMAMTRTRKPPYVAEDLRFAEELGDRAGLYIDNARLYRAAQQALRARDDLMGIVAHDLRNPLSAIDLQAQRLSRMLNRSESSTGEAGAAVDEVRKIVKRMSRLIDDVLDASRAEAGHLVPRLTACNPESLVREALAGVRALASSKGLDLRSEVAPELPLVQADAERVQQVFANLLGNAMKFTPHGGSIVLTATRSAGFVAFAVADSGSGISAADQAHIFARYWQGQRPDRQGAGLGLWLCKGIVEAHGGTLSVESSPGQGSRFTFTLPVAVPAS
jgi:PAS domain S-box-containing protein